MSVTTKNEVDPESTFYGDKTILVAKTGYGKSYTARVLIEEGVKKGNTFIVIDPQDAYKNIPDFEYIDAINIKSAKGLGILLAQSSRNVIISIKSLSIETQNTFMQFFLRAYKQNIRRGIQTLVIDEIHKFAPEGQNTPSKNEVRGLFQESRSDGLGIIGITQRPQRLDKTCLAQAENFAVGRVTAFRDKESIKTYLDNPNDVDKLSKLEKGEFFFFGFGFDDPLIAKVRKSTSEHSGNSPKNLLNEDKELYNRYSKKYIKNSRGNKMADNKIAIAGEPVKGVIPSMDGFKDLALIGMKASVGTAVSGIVGTLVASRLKSPIPVISSRTLGSLGTTIALYTGYRMIPMDSVKDILKYAAAGSAAFSVGSITFDLLNVANIQLPSLVNFALSTATGAQNMTSSTDNSEVDTNTQFA